MRSVEFRITVTQVNALSCVEIEYERKQQREFGQGQELVDGSWVKYIFVVSDLSGTAYSFCVNLYSKAIFYSNQTNIQTKQASNEQY